MSTIESALAFTSRRPMDIILNERGECQDELRPEECGYCRHGWAIRNGEVPKTDATSMQRRGYSYDRPTEVLLAPAAGQPPLLASDFVWYPYNKGQLLDPKATRVHIAGTFARRHIEMLLRKRVSQITFAPAQAHRVSSNLLAKLKSAGVGVSTLRTNMI
jgi:hypothetical protein